MQTQTLFKLSQHDVLALQAGLFIPLGTDLLLGWEAAPANGNGNTYTCSRKPCGKSFHSRAGLTMHVLRVHRGVGPQKKVNGKRTSK